MYGNNYYSQNRGQQPINVVDMTKPKPPPSSPPVYNHSQNYPIPPMGPPYQNAPGPYFGGAGVAIGSSAPHPPPQQNWAPADPPHAQQNVQVQPQNYRFEVSGSTGASQPNYEYPPQ